MPDQAPAALQALTDALCEATDLDVHGNPDQYSRAMHEWLAREDWVLVAAKREWATLTPAGNWIRWDNERDARRMGALTNHPVGSRLTGATEWQTE